MDPARANGLTNEIVAGNVLQLLQCVQLLKSVKVKYVNVAIFFKISIDKYL